MMFRRCLTAVLIPLCAVGAEEIRPEGLITLLQQQAALENPQFAGFDARRGEQFFKNKPTDWSCTTCHTEDPLQPGRHKVTEKRIEPLAPDANPRRFTEVKKVTKWFKRNCNDVLKRACTVQEQGDVLAYLMSLKAPVSGVTSR